MCSQYILKILRNLNVWLLKYDLWKRTAHNERNVNIQMHFATWQMITLLWCVCYDENKKNLNFFYYNYKTIHMFKKHKMLNLSFQTFFHKHISKIEKTE